mmetsp:Transcript_7208/g.17927  ORF Transcript_7208/g.17927 Transcript_7208/m.17927 type:complete len:133 (+) Transcript_7208:1308-1706(+)
MYAIVATFVIFQVGVADIADGNQVWIVFCQIKHRVHHAFHTSKAFSAIDCLKGSSVYAADGSGRKKYRHSELKVHHDCDCLCLSSKVFYEQWVPDGCRHCHRPPFSSLSILLVLEMGSSTPGCSVGVCTDRC